jgi:uncharacterized protein (TIGR02246 family)
MTGFRLSDVHEKALSRYRAWGESEQPEAREARRPLTSTEANRLPDACVAFHGCSKCSNLNFGSPEKERSMLSRNTIRSVLPVVILILVGALPGLNGWMGLSQARSQANPRPDVAEATRPAQSADEKAIRAVDDVFISNYNMGDSKALTALFTDDAEVVEADGSRYQGRVLIEQSFVDTFASSKGVKISFEIEAILFLSPDVAKEEGRSLVTPAKGSSVSRL